MIYIIRHAECETNLNGTFNGHMECDITENGRMQILYLEEYLKNIEFDIKFVSPLLRAQKTSIAVKSKEAIAVDVLMEVNGGEWEGKPMHYIKKTWPCQYDNIYFDLINCRIPNGCDLKAEFEKMKFFADKVYELGKTKKVAVIGHAVNLQLLIAHLLHETPKELKWINNASVSMFEYSNQNEKYTCTDFSNNSFIPKQFSKTVMDNLVSEITA
jgi:broad specificity phosphatase PhoE